MPSVMVNWWGQCADPAIRQGLTAKLLQLGRLSHSLFEPPLPEPREAKPLAGRILVLSELFQAENQAGNASQFIELPAIDLSGLEFRFFDPRNIYKGEDRISFVFATLPGRPETAGSIIQVEEKDRCVLYDDPAIKAADYFIKRASIHLRYYCEDWIDGFLAFVKHYYVPDMKYWRYENLPGYAQYTNLDPKDADERERRWARVLSGFMQEAQAFLGKGQELRARLDHMNRTGIMPPSWAFAPYSPLKARLTVGPDLAAALPKKADRTALLSATRLAIIKSRKGFDLFYLSFGFRHLTIAASSRLLDDNLLVIHADIAPNGQLLAIAENEARDGVVRAGKRR